MKGNQFIIIGCLIACVVSEVNAMNQTLMVQARSRLTTAAIGGLVGYKLGRYNNPLLKSPLKQSLLYGSLFALFNSHAGLFGVLSGCAVLGGLSRLCKLKSWQKFAFVGAFLGGCTGMVLARRYRRRFIWTVRINPAIDRQEENVSQNDPEFVRINREFDEHAVQKQPYRAEVHREGMIAGKRWFVDIDARVLQQNDRGQFVTWCRELDENGVYRIRFEPRGQQIQPEAP